MSAERPERRSGGIGLPEAAPVVLVTVLIGLYFVLRYGGNWIETDTASLTRAMRAVLETGRLAAPEQYIYSNGYFYPSIGALLALVGGLEPALLQQLVLPFAVVLLAVPACLLFYEITGSRRRSLLGALLLFTQPEFLFVVLRGSHEKFGRLFMILALFLLIRSFKTQGSVRLFGANVLLFYLAAYALLASNFLIGFSFVFTIVVGLLGGLLLERFRLRAPEAGGHAAGTSRRLAMIVPAVFILAFILMFYLYPPVQAMLRTMDTMFERSRALLLGGESTDVYGGVLGAWIHPAVYVVVNLPNWLVLAGSLGVFAWRGYQWVFRRQAPSSRASWLLWLLFGAFGFQAALSIVSDASGAFGNLQHRLFPSFALLGVALIVDAAGEWRLGLPRTAWGRAGAGLLVFLMALFSLLKATNEATLVNYWVFHRLSERTSLKWYDTNSRDAYLWIGLSYRLGELFTFQTMKKTTNLVYAIKIEDMPHVLITDVIRQQSARTRIPLPDVSGYQTIYDNGQAQIYYHRPVTPYQR